MTTTILHSTEFLQAPAAKLYLLDFGLFQVHENNRIIDIPGYLIVTMSGEKILVDTGFPAQYAHNPDEAALEDGLESFGRVLHLTEDNLPPGQLARIGLTPADIDLLVLTHSDIDHIGGIDHFADVPVIIAAPSAICCSVSKFSRILSAVISRMKYQTVAFEGTTFGWSPPSTIT